MAAVCGLQNTRGMRPEHCSHLAVRTALRMQSASHKTGMLHLCTKCEQSAGRSVDGRHNATDAFRTQLCLSLVPERGTTHAGRNVQAASHLVLKARRSQSSHATKAMYDDIITGHMDTNDSYFAEFKDRSLKEELPDYLKAGRVAAKPVAEGDSNPANDEKKLRKKAESLILAKTNAAAVIDRFYADEQTEFIGFKKGGRSRLLRSQKRSRIGSDSRSKCSTFGLWSTRPSGRRRAWRQQSHPRIASSCPSPWSH